MMLGLLLGCQPEPLIVTLPPHYEGWVEIWYGCGTQKDAIVGEDGRACTTRSPVTGRMAYRFTQDGQIVPWPESAGQPAPTAPQPEAVIVRMTSGRSTRAGVEREFDRFYVGRAVPGEAPSLLGPPA